MLFKNVESCERAIAKIEFLHLNKHKYNVYNMFIFLAYSSYPHRYCCMDSSIYSNLLALSPFHSLKIYINYATNLFQIFFGFFLFAIINMFSIAIAVSSPLWSYLSYPEFTYILPHSTSEFIPYILYIYDPSDLHY